MPNSIFSNPCASLRLNSQRAVGCHVCFLLPRNWGLSVRGWERLAGTLGLSRGMWTASSLFTGALPGHLAAQGTVVETVRVYRGSHIGKASCWALGLMTPEKLPREGSCHDSCLRLHCFEPPLCPSRAPHKPVCPLRSLSQTVRSLELRPLQAGPCSCGLK